MILKGPHLNIDLLLVPAPRWIRQWASTSPLASSKTASPDIKKRQRTPTANFSASTLQQMLSTTPHLQTNYKCVLLFVLILSMPILKVHIQASNILTLSTANNTFFNLDKPLPTPSLPHMPAIAGAYPLVKDWLLSGMIGKCRMAQTCFRHEI